MKFILLTLISFILISNNVLAQDLKWEAYSSEYVVSFVLDADDNSYVIGYFEYPFTELTTNGWVTITNTGIRDSYIKKIDSSGNVAWIKHVGGNENTEFRSIDIDLYGNVYIAGTFTGTTDFDPDSIFDHNITSSGDEDAFVLMLNGNGIFGWANKFGGPNKDFATLLKVSGSGSIYVSGSHLHDADFDPGPALVTFQFGGNFLLKLSSSGSYEWVIHFVPYITSIAIGNNGSLYVIGGFGGSSLFPGIGGNILLTSADINDIFISKFDASGNLQWVKQIGGKLDDFGESITLDADLNIYITGSFSDTVDFDPGPNQFLEVVNSFGYNCFVLKLDSLGNFVWVKRLTGGNSSGFNIAVDNYGSSYLIGSFNGTVDFNPGVLTDTFTSSVLKTFVLKLDTYGNFLWVHQNANVYNYNIRINNSKYFWTLIANILSKWEEDKCAQMIISVDSILNINCGNLTGYAVITPLFGNPPYAVEWNTVPPIFVTIAYFSQGGIYTVTVTDSVNCERTSSILITPPITFSGFDLNSNLVSGIFRTGFLTNVTIDAFNDGCLPVTGELHVVFDTLLAYSSSNNSPTSFNGDTITWSFTNLTFDSTHLAPNINFLTSTSAAIGDTVCFNIIVTPIAGDVNQANNFKTYCFPVLNSYDPNDKQVYPQGACDVNYVLKTEKLTYTTRFQNTGNADAINVFILDTLSQHLDLQTVRVIGKSHQPLITEVLSGNVLKFRFDNINLPDSATNEPESQGYVIFEVLPLAGAANGTVVENRVGIYFDFNEPVITNTVTNTLIDIIPSDTTILPVSACDNYMHNGTSYTTSGSFNQLLKTFEGCDSLVVLNLSIANSSFSTINENSCDTFTLNNQTYTSSGVYQQMLVNSHGCDSTITLNLTINSSLVVNLSEVSCDNFTLNNQTYTSSGMYNQTLSTASGCDSLLVLDLTIVEVDSSVSVNQNTLTATETSASYQWLDCDNNFSPINNATGQSFTATSNGNYAVAITKDGCSATSACKTVTGIGVEETHFARSLKIFPNPTSGELTIDFAAVQPSAEIEVRNLIGQVVQKVQTENQREMQISLDGAQGLYFIIIRNQQKEQVVLKVVKE